MTHPIQHDQRARGASHDDDAAAVPSEPLPRTPSCDLALDPGQHLNSTHNDTIQQHLLASHGYDLEVDSSSDRSHILRSPDNDTTDSDSAIGSSSANSVTTSLNSQVQDYRFEFGRRYHAFREDQYWLPNDEDEADRLDLQHHVWRMTLDGALYAAPLAPDIHRVLDIGTGSGIWAIEFAEEHPSSHVIGTDLSPIQPEWTPPNCQFWVDDAERDWDFGGTPFDFVHARMLILGMHDWRRFFEQAWQHLAPGGWVEVQDVCLPVRCDDDSVGPDDPLATWSHLVREAAGKGGIDTEAGTKFGGMLSEQGFINIKEECIKWAIGSWPRGKKQKQIGVWTLENLSQGLQGISLALFTRQLGWSREEVELFLVDVRKDINDRSKHYYWVMYNVFAQKPLEDQQAPSPDRISRSNSNSP
ncbi:S-adenosyl-L-methionine-dependent methyltransferase [Phyllosticta capitalensis]|uniref:S-adenosyl-L-methionine-dependent methyltransferase n=1 Tax=Phyllosticta capitalensis TaxID=121624 RepID=A0ABR1YFI6_9PEZI